MNLQQWVTALMFFVAVIGVIWIGLSAPGGC